MNGERMKELRISAGLRMGEVARELGVHRNTVQRWEDGAGIRGVPATAAKAFESLLFDVDRIHYLRAGRRRVRRIRGAE